MKWQILSESKDITKTLLDNRGIKSKKEKEDFLKPRNPLDISLEEFGINKNKLKEVVKRLKEAKKKNERIVIFGDYDCDGICATAILWENLYSLGFDCLPYIPNRFSEGYGIKVESINKLKEKYEEDKKSSPIKLIITVDNGIVAYDAISKAKDLGIDVIVCDHHTLGDKKLTTKFILHSTKICGSALAYVLSSQFSKKIKGLELAAIGTISDQMQLIGVNRSIVKWGLEELSKTGRIGLKALINESKLTRVGVYEIGYILAPRINAMGRLANALDSLRLLCTKDSKKAFDLAKILGETNVQRQKIVDEVLNKALKQVKVESNEIIVISGDYHEGVIGLASGKVTEKYYRPSVVFSINKEISKASARSIYGFNIIEAIKSTKLILEGGGHPMAAGFSIKTEKIEEFTKKLIKISKSLLTDGILSKKLKIDMSLDFAQIDQKLIDLLKKFEPTGYGNFQPVFMTKKAEIIESKSIGSDGKHLKLKIRQSKITLDAVWFNYDLSKINQKTKLIDIAYTTEENIWNNRSLIQLKIKDINIT
ncbi:MAG: single-stranded-DNA-specific exonuclease RecJ [Candidatus Woesebacteria bacterium]|nr:single-stranded-DNA-specific exonuclease RecJ [Candidatus Woesebacteria bacterium]